MQRGSWVCICEACCHAASVPTIFDAPSKENIEIGGNGGKTANARGYNAFQDFKLLPASSHCSGNHECTLQAHENLFRYTVLKLAILSLHNAEAGNIAYARPL